MTQTLQVSLFNRASAMRYKEPVQCSAIIKSRASLCKKSSPNGLGCSSHKSNQQDLDKGRLAAKLVHLSSSMGYEQQAPVAGVIRFIDSNWDKVSGDTTRLTRTWFDQLEHQLISEDKTPASAILDNDLVETPASITPALVVGQLLSYISPFKAQADSVNDAKSTTRADAPSEDQFFTSQSAPNQIPTMSAVSGELRRLYTSVSNVQPRVHHSSVEGTDGYMAIETRLDEILGHISALSIRLDNLQFVTFASLELQGILADKLQHVVVSANADESDFN